MKFHKCLSSRRDAAVVAPLALVSKPGQQAPSAAMLRTVGRSRRRVVVVVSPLGVQALGPVLGQPQARRGSAEKLGLVPKRRAGALGGEGDGAVDRLRLRTDDAVADGPPILGLGEEPVALEDAIGGDFVVRNGGVGREVGLGMGSVVVRPGEGGREPEGDGWRRTTDDAYLRQRARESQCPAAGGETWRRWSGEAT